MCFAFLSLALIHVLHLLDPRGGSIGFIDLLISLLLLIGLAHIESVFGSQLRFEGKEHTLRSELRSLSRRFEEIEESNASLSRLNSQHVQRSQELEQSARQFHTLFMENPLPMWIIDLRSLGFLEVNRAALREYGFTEAEFRAVSPRGLYPAEDVEAFIQDAARPKPAGGNRTTWRHVHKDGAIADVELTACDLFYAERPARLVIVENVTRKRQLETAERHNVKLEAFAQLAGGFVQQFSTSFIALDEQASRLSKKPAAAGIADDLRHIANAASRAATVSRQLLVLSGKQPIAHEQLDLNETLKQCLAALQPLIEKQIKIRLSTASNLPAISGDSAALQQVILNLVLNAREAMPSGGTLSITTTAVKMDMPPSNFQQADGPAGHFVCLTVADTGSGMAPEVQARLFEPFFTTRSHRKAAGLGLALSRAITQQHSGWIECQSELHAGSQLRVFLPAA